MFIAQLAYHSGTREPDCGDGLLPKRNLSGRAASARHRRYGESMSDSFRNRSAHGKGN